jgi:hypothetical protein
MIARVIGSTVLAASIAVAFAASSTTVSGQTPQSTVAQAPRQAAPPAAPAAAPARTTTRRAAVPRTEDGRPNLMGVWAYATITPFERPDGLGTKAEFASDAEVEQYEKQNQRRSQDDRPNKGTAGDVGGAYNDFWWDRGTKVAGRQTSLVVDPPNGRIPATLPEATKRNQERNAARPRPAAGIDAENPEDRSLWERCVARTIPYTSGPYNNNIQIVQTRDYVVIVSEMIHEARIVPTMAGAKHGTVRKWHGDSIGRWEGDTLVVETTHFNDKAPFRGSNYQTLKLTERFSRPDADTLIYEYTVEDPTTWARPWTVRHPMAFNPEGIFEYACHENNYGLEGILKGSRQLEKDRASGAAAPRPPAPTPAAR